MVMNPFYIGKTRWNYAKHNKARKINSKEEWIIAYAQHEPLVSEEIWQKANEKLEAGRRPTGISGPPQFIAQLMGISWGALAGAFLAPFLLGLHWKGVTRASVWACFVWGVGLTVVNMLSGNRILNPINCGALAMLGGFVVVPVVSLLTPKLPKAHVDGIFACYGRK